LVMVDTEVLRVARLLEAVVKVEKMPVRTLERSLGLGGGTLNRIFSGRIELKLRHILLILQTVGVKPDEFFRYAFEERTPEDNAGTAWIREAVKRMLRQDEEPAPRPAPNPAEVSPDALRKMVMDVLTEFEILPPPKRGKRGKTS